MTLDPKILECLDLNWLEDMFLYAVDYCLGRMSYAPDTCMSFLEPCIPYLTNRGLGVIFRRINNYKFGRMDYPEDWNAFKLKVESELQKRGWKYNEYAY